MFTKLIVEAPESLKRPMMVPEKLLMGPGPSNMAPRVRQALSLPMLGVFHQEMYQIMDDVKAGLQYVFQTSNTLTLVVSASGHGGMEAALCNLIEKDDVVLIGVNGIWGERAAEMARRYGARVQVLEQTPGKHFCSDRVEEAIKKHRPVLFFITHGDSSTGVCQPLTKLGPLCHKYNCLFVVDTVASLGGVPVFTDQWEIDVNYAGSQKVLGAAPGLAPITFSPRAWHKIQTRKTPVAVFYFDVTILGNYWACFGNPRIYHHTMSASLLYGLREALAMVCEEGLHSCWQRHQLVARQLYLGVARLGLQLFVERDDIRLATVTTITIPRGLDWKRLQQYCMDKYMLEVAAGLGPTAGLVLRIGLMGYNATPDNVQRTLQALEEGLEFARNAHAKL